MALEANDIFHGHIRPILGHYLGCDRLRDERAVGIRILVSPTIGVARVGLCNTLLLLYFSYTKGTTARLSHKSSCAWLPIFP